jgi:gliding motility-associated-like protein
MSILRIPPPQFYPSSNVTSDIPVQLIVKNIAGCADTATKTIRVVGNCYIAIPKGFSPNSDGLNDFLYPTNAYKARDLLFRVYNRTGQLLFETRDWTNKWDGTFKGSPQDPGTYVWILNYTNIDTGKRFELKGSTVLIR